MEYTSSPMHDLRASHAKRGARAWLHRHYHEVLIGAGLISGALLIAIVGIIWNYTQERHDLPRFDHAKAARLSTEKRAEFENLLFAEIPYWDGPSPRFGGPRATRRREAEWQRMADNGYELAHLTLLGLSPAAGTRYDLKRPLQRLIELADAGDAAAMCLIHRLVEAANDIDAYRRHRYQIERFVARGAQLGHAACLGAVTARQYESE